MRIYEVHPLIAALMFMILVVGIVTALIVFPIACIQWVWNASVANWTILPQIALWQAGLLYLAGATLLYLSGLVKIEFKIGDAE